MSIARCERRRPGVIRCGQPLTMRIVGYGKLEATCAACARCDAGICQLCPQPVAGVVGRAGYCERCRKLVRRQADREWRARQVDQVPAVVAEQRRRARLGSTPLTPQERGRLAGLTRAHRLSARRRREIARLGGLTAKANREARQLAESAVRS